MAPALSLLIGLAAQLVVPPAASWTGRLAAIDELPPPAPDEHRVALVVGNGDYLDAPLDNAVADAELVAGALRRVGFEVLELHDLDRRTFGRALQAFSRALRPDSVALFYYSGHGFQHEGRNYLLPLDAEISTERLMVLDACRNSPLAMSQRGLSGGLAAIDAPRGTLLVYATAPGKTASDGTGEHSPFSEALADELLSSGAKVEDVLKRVRRRVDEASEGRQLPWQSSSLLGDFYFVPPGQAALPPAAARSNTWRQQALPRDVHDDHDGREADDDDDDDELQGPVRSGKPAFEVPKLISRAYLYTSGGLAAVAAAGACLICCAPAEYLCFNAIGLVVGLIVQSIGVPVVITIAAVAAAVMVGAITIQAALGVVGLIFGLCSAPTCLIAGFTQQYFFLNREEDRVLEATPSTMRY
jgi:hypothetical protein